jgi:hypothetical protein
LPAIESKEDDPYRHDAPPVIILLGKIISANDIITIELVNNTPIRITPKLDRGF